MKDSKKFCEGQGEKSEVERSKVAKSKVGKVQSPKSKSRNLIIIARRRAFDPPTSDLALRTSDSKPRTFPFQKIILLNLAGMRIFELP